MELQPIQNKIYEIRGYRVMFDFDLAILYGTETKRLKEAVRRNIERFPDDFMFQLTKYEWDELVANCVQLPKNLKHSYIIPLAFTQEGVAMLSGVLRSEVAIGANIRIMRAFVAMRNLIAYTVKTKDLEERVKVLEETNEEILKDINDLSEYSRNNLDDIYIALAELADKQKKINEIQNKPPMPIGFDAIKKRREAEELRIKN